MSSDWNEEFTKLVRQGIGDAGAQAEERASWAGEAASEAPRAPGEARAASNAGAAGPDSEQAAAARRGSIASTLVALGFIARDRATPDNPAVEVLAELLPLDAEVELCLTCNEFSCSGPYEFAHATGRFPDVATMRRRGMHAVGDTLVKGPRRDLVVCTRDAVCWTQSRARGEREDSVTLYSIPFSDILGATVRRRRRGVVEMYIDDGPTVSFGVAREVADVLRAQVDRALDALEHS